MANLSLGIRQVLDLCHDIPQAVVGVNPELLEGVGILGKDVLVIHRTPVGAAEVGIVNVPKGLVRARETEKDTPTRGMK